VSVLPMSVPKVLSNLGSVSVSLNGDEPKAVEYDTVPACAATEAKASEAATTRDDSFISFLED
jgi:hypothetical protein